ncbi:nitroreductase family protein [Agreia pratensis]|uniref:Nitroreductase family protein n=1 Tax=Agreia pratensis TaxID=150121 RepID=A0A1X7JJR5_9MICO|nr:nitroreductase family protein [Agreia pratensis]MBF4634943.1 nitroreductase family protein [Agreia pratensis]SMG27554.1 Nitroreductase family protein [Agreia pratensis]
MTLTTTTAVTRADETSAPILEVLAARWSPRSYDPTVAIDEQALASVLEAGRWSPSAANTQPWRFIVARRGSEAFDKIVSNLMGFNQAWTPNAAALIVNLAETTDPDGKPRPMASYDLGQAVAHMSVQAHHEGLHVHQMSGIIAEGLRDAFSIPENFTALTVTALGTIDSPEALGEEGAIAREKAPRERFPLDELVLVNE